MPSCCCRLATRGRAVSAAGAEAATAGGSACAAAQAGARQSRTDPLQRRKGKEINRIPSGRRGAGRGGAARGGDSAGRQQALRRRIGDEAAALQHQHAVADLDHFKEVNDRLGHTIGDKALRESALLLKSLCKESDLVARIGGEEFALILPGLTRETAAAFCEQLRRAVESNHWQTLHVDLGVTISIGLTQWDGSAEVDELIATADAQLYRAKRAGRNQVA